MIVKSTRSYYMRSFLCGMNSELLEGDFEKRLFISVWNRETASSGKYVGLLNNSLIAFTTALSIHFHVLFEKLNVHQHYND